MALETPIQAVNRNTGFYPKSFSFNLLDTIRYAKTGRTDFFFYSRGRIHFYVLVYEDTCAPAGAVRWTWKTKLRELATRLPRSQGGGSAAAGWRISWPTNNGRSLSGAVA